MADSYYVEAHGLDDLAVKLRHAAELGKLEADVALALVGEEFKETAKAIAGEHSQSIPPSIHAEVLPGLVRVTAGGKQVPVAGLYEIGNRGSKRTSKTFRHPVFGKDIWVEQPRHRFFATARSRLRLVMHKQMHDAWKRGIREAGVKIEDY